MAEHAKAEVGRSLDPVTQWGLVIEGFQITTRKLHRAVAAAFSLDPAEAETLLRLTRSPERRMSMAALAREAAFSTGGFTKIADRLAKRDLVVRTPCADDRRVVYLELTAAGVRLADELQNLVADIVRKTYIDVLGADRATTVAEAMAELREANATL
ncbi:MarR family winged helix-turn-helix transcriptional regulator [Arthrobacter sp. AZCC_0090]|uniref:MarR family winged helix-turn-helix transcriptional regulator n=1 Tax=Arthrobacter sp. AZCC_0090 TaxID=2735881 RepID=UPI00160E90D5|nr:MarR family transcriptional regulator [Arthrobacter sp. AZCC_0090]MBB6406417.1 DNA-binding MarR family transcriptional regulator [Arthrobacter sp. AZCC_0090]